MTNNNSEIAAIEDSLTIANVKAIYSLFADSDDNSPEELDLKGVQEIDGAGLQLLCHLKKMATSKNTNFNLENLEEPVMAAITFANLNEFLGVK